MGDEVYPIKYNAPPGITLRKAEHPPGGGQVPADESAQVEYARAPAAAGPQPAGVRPPALQRSTR